MATETWITVAVSDLKPYLAAAGVSAYQTAALGVAQPDPFEEHMPTVIAEIRESIASCARNVLSETANSIPRSLKGLACLWIIKRMEGRLPGVSLTDGQKDELSYEKERLAKIAAGDLAVTIPDDPAESEFQVGAAAELLTSTCDITSRCKMDGMA